MKNKFYKVYNDYVVRESIDGNIDFDTDILNVIEMVEYDQMGIELFYSNRDKIGQDILYKSKPFELTLNESFTLVEIIEKNEPENHNWYRKKIFYKEVCYHVRNLDGNILDFRKDIGLNFKSLDDSQKNLYKDEIAFFLTGPFSPISYNKMSEHLNAINNSLFYSYNENVIRDEKM